MNDFIEVRQIVTIIFRRWWVIVLGVVLGAASAFLISRGMRPVYEATGTLLVGQSIQAADLNSADIQIGEHLVVTYAEIGRRQPVLDRVVDTLGLDVDWQQLRRRVHITPIAGTQLLEISVESTSPAEARMIADEIAHQMILLSPSNGPSEEEAQSQAFLEERLESLRLRIENGQRRIEDLEADMPQLRTSEIRAYQTEIDSLEQMITDWEANYAQLLALVGSDSAANHLTQIEAAEVKPEPIRPRVSLNTLIGAMLGLVLALGVIIVREYLDDSLRSVDDVEKGLGLNALGAVSKIKGSSDHDKLIGSETAYSPAVEAFNVIRSNVKFMSDGRTPGTLLITSAATGEGKSLTAANLGVAMARAGLETVIVDADLRRPMQHLIFETPNLFGVSEILQTPEPSIENAVTKTSIELLHVLTSGKRPPNPSELLSSDNMELLLAGLVERFQVVILDGPPVLTAADAALLSRVAEAVILVVKSGSTRRQEAQRTVMVLQQAGATLLGVVLNQAPRGAHDYHYLPHNLPEIEGEGDRYAAELRLRPSALTKTGLAKGIRILFNGRHDAESISDADA